MSRIVMGDYEHYQIMDGESGPRSYTWARCKHCPWTSARIEGMNDSTHLNYEAQLHVNVAHSADISAALTATKVRRFLGLNDEFGDEEILWSVSGITLTWGDLRTLALYTGEEGTHDDPPPEA